MKGALEVLRYEFSGLRTGRASASLLDSLAIDAYGTEMRLNQVASINAPEPRLLTVQVWDKSMAKAVEKSILASGLGLNPIAEGQLIRVPIPELNEERRRELSKVAGSYAEQARIAVRNVRRDGMDQLKRMQRTGDLSKDDQHAWGEEIQQTTDGLIKQIDEHLETKEKEIMQV